MEQAEEHMREALADALEAKAKWGKHAGLEGGGALIVNPLNNQVGLAPRCG